jgi:hypothetical protein
VRGRSVRVGCPGNLRSVVAGTARKLVGKLVCLEVDLDLVQVPLAGGGSKLLFFAYWLVLFFLLVDYLLERSGLFVGFLGQDEMAGKILKLLVPDQVLAIGWCIMSELFVQ